MEDSPMYPSHERPTTQQGCQSECLYPVTNVAITSMRLDANHIPELGASTSAFVVDNILVDKYEISWMLRQSQASLLFQG